MKTALSLSALVATALAQVQFFSAIALRSAAPFNEAGLSAAEQKFWLTVTPTESYCPLADPAACPAGTDTIFASDCSSDTLSMDVEVPGGQQVYIGPDGAMSFTQAHSATIPPGSTLGGWSRREESSSNIVYLEWQGGLIACPVEGKGYQIFGMLPNIEYDPLCWGFATATWNQTEVGAWQYV